MNAFDKVIGYRALKKELLGLCDMIRNREYYEEFGATLPKGILLEGSPGLGKTLLAKCFIEECGLSAFVIRKNKNENFADHITGVFEKAKASAPCILFLDDMDKFANEDDERPDAAEYVAVQTGIDEVKETDVFLIATVNHIQKLPHSLIRAGRFDRRISVERPESSDCVKIIKHYLSKKKVSQNLNVDDIAKMISYSSCAELETIVNEAAIHAAFERKTVIDKDDFIYAVLKCKYGARDAEEIKDAEKLREIAVHEAGHAVMSELLIPGSVGIASIVRNSYHEINGLVHCCKKITDPQDTMIALAGKAAVDILLGTFDAGVEDDLSTAFRNIRYEIADLGKAGFSTLGVARGGEKDSEALTIKIETAVQTEMENKLYKARKILTQNKVFLEKTAQALLQKETLLYSDIQKIRNTLPKAQPEQLSLSA